MSKNRGKSKLSQTVLFNANKHVFHCEKSLGTLVYGQPSYIPSFIKTGAGICKLMEDIWGGGGIVGQTASMEWRSQKPTFIFFGLWKVG
jgi:hypothetical protein